MQTLCCNVQWCPAEGAAAVGIFPLTRQSVDLWPLSSTSNLWHHRTIPGLPEGGKMWTNPLSTMLWVTRRSKVRHNQQHVDRNSVMYMCVCVCVSWLPGVSWLHLLLFYRHAHTQARTAIFVRTLPEMIESHVLENQNWPLQQSFKGPKGGLPTVLTKTEKQ